MRLKCSSCSNVITIKHNLDLLDYIPIVCSKDCFSNFIDELNNLSDIDVDKVKINNVNLLFKNDWETIFANILNSLRIEYEYESYLLKDNSVIFIPDFYLPQFNIYFEIKGRWTPYYKRVFRHFTKYGKNLWLIDRDILDRISRY